MSFKGLADAPLQETLIPYSFRYTVGLFSSPQWPGFQLAAQSRPRRLHTGSEWIAFPQKHQGLNTYVDLE